jgi:hypothetical protein
MPLSFAFGTSFLEPQEVRDISDALLAVSHSCPRF